MRIENDIKLDFDDVLIKPKRSELKSRKDVKLEREYTFLHTEKKWSGVPIIAANMDSVGTFEAAKVLQKHKMITAIHKYYSLEDWKKNYHELDSNYVVPTIGIRDEDFEFLNVLYDFYQPFFVNIDVANGYGQHFVEYVEEIKNLFANITIIAGNVVSADMVQELLLKGASIVKCGIGSGALCTSRIVAGVGVPQLSMIIECADAGHGLNGQIISDGGCKNPGDVAKAFGAGADFVMLGNILAGHEENAIEKEGKVLIRGMSSKSANEEYSGGLKNYKASEGREVYINNKGKIENTLNEIKGGLRSACTYTGAWKLKDLSKCTTFVRVNETHNRFFEK